jgi:hypothetical protein
MPGFRAGEARRDGGRVDEQACRHSRSETVNSEFFRPVRRRDLLPEVRKGAKVEPSVRV